MRRIGLAFESWPELDRATWNRAVIADDLFGSASVASRWRPATVATVKVGYWLALGWLQREGGLDPKLSPSARCPQDKVVAYARHLETRGLRPATIRHQLVSLVRALAVLDPDGDRSQLKAIARRLPPGDGADRKRPRLRDTDELLELGFRLMAKAEAHSRQDSRQTAVLYRDGLQIALLAVRPLRLKNFANLKLDGHLAKRFGNWWITIPADETKGTVAVEVPFPETLVTALERYLDCYRAVLAGPSCPGQRLWLTIRGTPQAEHSLQLAISHRTKLGFGMAVNPHLFRDCAATSIAVHNSEQVQMTAAILGHRSLATTERHYNLASSLSAGRKLADLVTQRRRRSRDSRRPN